jgi:hypothetical protein
MKFSELKTNSENGMVPEAPAGPFSVRRWEQLE